MQPLWKVQQSKTQLSNYNSGKGRNKMGCFSDNELPQKLVFSVKIKCGLKENNKTWGVIFITVCFFAYIVAFSL